MTARRFGGIWTLMLPTVFILLALTVAAGWIGARARALTAFIAILIGIVWMVAASEVTPAIALSASVLMAAGSVALGGLYFGPRISLAFGLVTALPFAFVAFAAWPLSRAPETADAATDLVLLAGAGVVALVALAAGSPKTRKKSLEHSS